MKHTAGYFLTVILAFVLLTGCGRVGGREIPVRELKPDSYEQFALSVIAVRTSQAAAPEETAESTDSGDLTDLMPKEGWPAAQVPADLPAYTDGKVVNSGGEADDYYIKIENTSPEALSRYAEELQNAGWSVSESDAVKGVYRVVFDWNDSASTFLQIEIIAEEVTGWPYGEIPPDIVPPDTGTLVGATPLSGSDEGGWYFNFIIDGMDQEAASAYMQKLLNSGWSGDISMIFKDVTWNGKPYGVSIEIYESDETRTTFICGFGLAGGGA
jgi:hypothetical protein